MKKLTMLIFAFVLLLFPVVSALPVTIDEVRIENFEVTPNNVNLLAVERGKDLELKIKLTATQDMNDLEFLAYISGYEFNHLDEERLADTSPLFDVKLNHTYVKTLRINLPDIVETDNYKLRLMLLNRNDQELVQHYNIAVEPERHVLKVEDILLSPGSTVQAGHPLLVSVRLANRGQKDEDDIKVTASIPQLDVSASDFIDEVEKENEEEETEELYLRIPDCAKEGTYDLKIDVEYNERRETLSANKKITVLGNDCEEGTSNAVKSKQGGKTFVTVGSQMETVPIDSYAIFPVTLTNTAKTSKSYTFLVNVPNGLQHRITPTSSAVLEPGQSQTFHIFVSANDDATAGPNTLTVTVNPGKENTSVMLTANVLKKNEWFKTVLVFGTVLLGVLVILLLAIHLSGGRREEELFVPRPPKSEFYY